MTGRWIQKALCGALSAALLMGSVPAVGLLAAAEPPVSVTVANGTGLMNLTSKGSLDWIHMTSDVVNRKLGGGKRIKVSNLSSYGVTNMDDSPVSYFWTDGSVSTITLTNRKGAVYNYKPGDEAGVGKVTEDAGFLVTIPAADYTRTVTLAPGAWQATAEFSICVNGGDEPVYTNTVTAAGTSTLKIYTITVQPGYSLEIRQKMTNRTTSWGNVTIGGIALSEAPQTAAEAEAVLSELVTTASGLDTSEIDQTVATNLQTAISESNAVLSGSPTIDECTDSLSDLRQAYLAVVKALEAGNYTYESNSGLTASFGWEGDLHAPIAYLDGSYKLRDNDNLVVTFGVKDVPGKIKWYNKEGYLPCFVSEYSKNDLEFVIENFADKVTIDGKDFEIAYSRMTVKNTGEETAKLPVVSEELIPLNEAARTATTVEPGETVVRDYCIGADRFGGSYLYPADEVLAEEGGFDQHYEHMKSYWDERLSGITVLSQLPDEDLINAYKAGYIYTLIVRDDKTGSDGTVTRELHVGENGYDATFDHDAIGITATLFTLGDYTYAKEYLNALRTTGFQYLDAKWKYSWPFALYLLKTGDKEFVESKFETISQLAHEIHTDRTAEGIMKTTDAVDSNGQWTIDNWGALMGLTAYEYICTQLGKTEEAQWAAEEYDSLLTAVEKQVAKVMEETNTDYLSLSMTTSTDNSARSDPRDANWASMFLFGRWGWDGYLFGADQEDSLMIDLIDDTYAWGIERRSDISDSMYNFGGYPHGYYSSAYNAGYGSTALRGEEFRDMGIKAYQFMIENSMSGPFSWWEGIAYPNTSSPWDTDHASGGGGSCQHIWGQSTASKVLVDSLIAEKVDGTVIIGRGIPTEWIQTGETVALSNYPVQNNRRVGYTLTTSGKTVNIDFSGDDLSAVRFSVELISLKDNIVSVTAKGADGETMSGVTFDKALGTVSLPAGTASVSIEMEQEEAKPNTGAANRLQETIDRAEEMDASLYTDTSYAGLIEAVDAAKTLLTEEADTDALRKATTAINEAIQALVSLEVPVGPDYTTTASTGGQYEFGKVTDQYRRFQTFKITMDGTISSVDLSVVANYKSLSSLSDMIVELYSVQDDGKTLDTLLKTVTVDKEEVVNGGGSVHVSLEAQVEAGKTYAIALGQVTTSNDNNYRWNAYQKSEEDIYFIKWNKTTAGGDTFVDETKLGQGGMKIHMGTYSKKALQDLIQEQEAVSSTGYTQESYEAFLALLDEARQILETSTDVAQIQAWEAKVASAATDLLVPVGEATGDVNNDGLVNSSDARLVLQYTVELTTLTSAQQALADVVKDGRINSSDARWILQKSVGLV